MWLSVYEHIWEILHNFIAYAKIYGGYFNIPDEKIENVLIDLTGAPVANYELEKIINL